MRALLWTLTSEMWKVLLSGCENYTNRYHSSKFSAEDRMNYLRGIVHPLIFGTVTQWHACICINVYSIRNSLL